MTKKVKRNKKETVEEIAPVTVPEPTPIPFVNSVLDTTGTGYVNLAEQQQALVDHINENPDLHSTHLSQDQV